MRTKDLPGLLGGSVAGSRRWRRRRRGCLRRLSDHPRPLANSPFPSPLEPQAPPFCCTSSLLPCCDNSAHGGRILLKVSMLMQTASYPPRACGLWRGMAQCAHTRHAQPCAGRSRWRGACALLRHRVRFASGSRALVSRPLTPGALARGGIHLFADPLSSVFSRSPLSVFPPPTRACGPGSDRVLAARQARVLHADQRRVPRLRRRRSPAHRAQHRRGCRPVGAARSRSRSPRALQAGLRADRYLLAHHAIVLAGVAFGVAFGVGELHMAAISLNEASSPCLHARCGAGSDARPTPGQIDPRHAARPVTPFTTLASLVHDSTRATGSHSPPPSSCSGLAPQPHPPPPRPDPRTPRASIVVLLLLVVQVAWCWVALLPAWWPLASGSERAVLLALTLLLAGHTLVNFYWFSRIMAHVGRHVRLARRPSPAESPPRRAPPAAGAAHALDRSQMRVRRRREVGQGATKVKGAGGGNET